MNGIWEHCSVTQLGRIGFFASSVSILIMMGLNIYKEIKANGVFTAVDNLVVLILCVTLIISVLGVAFGMEKDKVAPSEKGLIHGAPISGVGK